MSRKIYISPSDQVKNLYAVGDTNEAVQCRAIARMLVEALERHGFQARTNEADGTSAMKNRVVESNAWGPDLHLSLHTNAHNGQVQGTRIFCYDLKGEGYKASQAVMAALAPLTPGESDSITTNNFYEVRKTTAPCVYLEVAFHDNPEEAQWIIDHKRDIAEAVCQGLCAYFGVAYQAPQSQLYRVQVGAYAIRENAENMVKKLEEAGFQGFVVG